MEVYQSIWKYTPDGHNLRCREIFTLCDIVIQLSLFITPSYKILSNIINLTLFAFIGTLLSSS